jgi:hypothetical protein
LILLAIGQQADPGQQQRIRDQERPGQRGKRR